MPRMLDFKKVKIREAEKKDYEKIRKVVLDGLYEHSQEAYKTKVFPSKAIQVFLVLLTAVVVMMFSFSTMSGFLVMAIFQCAIYISAIQFWNFKIREDSPDLCSLKDFQETYFQSPPAKFWVAEYCTSSSTNIIGTIALRKPSEETLRIMKSNGIHEGIELRRASVVKDFRGSGLAIKLMDTAMDYCRENLDCSPKNNTSVVLSTSEVQRAAVKLYNREGFSLIHVNILKAFGLSVKQYFFAKLVAKSTHE